MTPPGNCLSSDDIRVFLDGASSQLEDTVLVRHLDHCPACRAALEENAGGSLWLEPGLGHVPQPGPFGPVFHLQENAHHD